MKLNLTRLCLHCAIGIGVVFGSILGTSQPTVSQTEFPITSIPFINSSDNIQLARFVVPDTDTTRSAYGGQLRRYDVHLAKMFEVTDYECRRQSERNWSQVAWQYYAAGGDVNMGTFFITCNHAREIAIAYGLGQTEATSILYYRVTIAEDVPILNIVGDKIGRWLDFTRSFRPEF